MNNLSFYEYFSIKTLNNTFQFDKFLKRNPAMSLNKILDLKSFDLDRKIILTGKYLVNLNPVVLSFRMQSQHCV